MQDRQASSNMNIDELIELIESSNGIELEAIIRKYSKILYIDDIFDLCSIAVQVNGLTLKFVPLRLKTPEMCLEAIKNDPKALEFIPDTNEVLENQELSEFICDIVTKNPLALEYTPKAMKPAIIQKIGIENILRNNYAAVKFFPGYPDFNDQNDYKNKIDSFLDRIKYVVAVTHNDNRHDNIEKDKTYGIYSTEDNQIGKITRVYANDIDYILNAVKDRSNSINLVLLGHSSKESTSLAGIETDRICEILKNPIIKRLSLLGCNTVKSKQLDQEINMNRLFVSNNDTSIKNRGCGLMFVSNNLDKNKYEDILSKINLNENCMIAKESENKFSLTYFKRNTDNDSISLQKFMLTGKQVVKINSEILLAANNKMPIFPVDNNLFIQRNASKPLNDEDLKNILAICKKEKRFYRSHPDYKKDKEIYPHLTYVQITLDEANKKLLPSLMKRIVDRLQEINFDRPIEIKGYSKAIYLDKVNKCLHGSNEFLYFLDYDKFDIDYKKLKYDRKVSIKKMFNNSEDKETNVKSIILNYKPR